MGSGGFLTSGRTMRIRPRSQWRHRAGFQPASPKNPCGLPRLGYYTNTFRGVSREKVQHSHLDAAGGEREDGKGGSNHEGDVDALPGGPLEVVEPVGEVDPFIEGALLGQFSGQEVDPHFLPASEKDRDR